MHSTDLQPCNTSMFPLNLTRTSHPERAILDDQFHLQTVSPVLSRPLLSFDSASIRHLWSFNKRIRFTERHHETLSRLFRITPLSPFMLAARVILDMALIADGGARGYFLSSLSDATCMRMLGCRRYCSMRVRLRFRER